MSILLITLVVSYNLGYNTLTERVKNQLISEVIQREIALEQIDELRIQELKSLAATNEIQNIVNITNAIDSGHKVDMTKLDVYKDSLATEIIKFGNETGGVNGFDAVKIISKSGKIVFATDKSLIGKNFSNDKFSAEMKDGIRTLTLENGNVRAKVIVPIRNYLNNDSDTIGILEASTPPYYVNKILSNREGMGNTGKSYLVNSNGMIIAPTVFVDDTVKQKIDIPPVRECFEAKQNAKSNVYDRLSINANPQAIFGKAGVAYTNNAGVNVFGVSICEKNLGYVLIVEIKQQEILSPLLQLELEYFLVGMIISVIIIIAAHIISKGIIKPINVLKKVTQSIADGNLSVPFEVLGNDEIGELSYHVSKMQESLQFTKKNFDDRLNTKTESLKESNRELAENQIKLNESIKENSKIKMALDESSLVAITDKNGTITYANNKFSKVSKYSTEELIGQNHRILKSGYHPPEFYQVMWRTISSGKIWRGEIKNRAKDGTFYWVKTVIFPILDKDGKPVEYISVRTDITEQKLISDKLRTALKELQEIDKLKDEFGTMISHELRTPLIPVLGYAEMLLNHDLGRLSNTQHDAISSIYENATKLKKMIDDILLVQKLEIRQIKFVKHEIEIDHIMRKMYEFYKRLTISKNIELVNNTSNGQTVKSDVDKITEILANLIINATDFTPSGGRIEIGAQNDDTHVIFYVKDNGIGIPKEKQKDLFKKFYQVDTSLQRSHGGTGLGLAICKGLVEGLGGNIWVESEEGKGSTFYFTIPKE